MSSYENTILNHYHLSTPFPVEWPAEKDDADEPDEEATPTTAASPRSPHGRPKSRYYALEQMGNEGQTTAVRSHKSGVGLANPPASDEPDPLGVADSVVRLLRQRGLPVDDDAHLSEDH